MKRLATTFIDAERRFFDTKIAKNTKKKVRVKSCASREALNLDLASFAFFPFECFLASPTLRLASPVNRLLQAGARDALKRFQFST